MNLRHIICESYPCLQSTLGSVDFHMHRIQEIDGALQLEDKFKWIVTHYWPDILDKENSWVKTELRKFQDLTLQHRNHPSVLTLGYLYLNHLSCDFVMSDHKTRLRPLFSKYKKELFGYVDQHRDPPSTLAHYKGIMRHSDVMAAKTSASLGLCDLSALSPSLVSYLTL